MSVAIRHPFVIGSLFQAAARATKPAPAARRERPEARGGSLFHRWAADDFAARDVGFALFVKPGRR